MHGDEKKTTAAAVQTISVVSLLKLMLHTRYVLPPQAIIAVIIDILDKMNIKEGIRIVVITQA